jgi:FKBP-type peptidyl-prolyl cis-trans isomerase FklB
MIKRATMDVDLDTVIGALKDSMEGKESRLTDLEAQEVLRAHQQEVRRKMMEKNQELAEKNKKEGAAFLEENKNKPGVKVLKVPLSETNQAELQYKVITEGTGPIPGSNDTVTVSYKGTFINGKEFDSSEKHGGKPVKFRINGVIRGWTAALEHMKVGSKWELFVPSSLAYGDMGTGNGIEPGSTLIFEIELVSAEAPPTPQPLTSDIIKVPSAEELKKGAKIEVIKPEDAARMAEEAKKKQAEKQ